MIKGPFSQTILALVFISVGHPASSQKIKKCPTYVYNLSTGSSKSKDICLDISMIGHYDLNEFSPGRERDKTQDLWKFTISLVDNEKRTKQDFTASFYIYEDNDEIKQYHCVIESLDCKAIIFDKIHRSWQILLFQNSEYKILSSQIGYHFINAFGIKETSKSDINY